MSTAALTHEEHEHPTPKRAYKFGMIIFLLSEAMLFAGLIGGYIVLRVIGVGGEWPPAGAPDINVNFANLSVLNIVMLVNTAILISSSFTFHWAESSVKKGGLGLMWMFITIVFGTIFLSVQAYEWWHLHHEGLWFNTFGIYGSCFFVMTGFHGLHVFIGLLMIAWCFVKQLFTKSITAENHILMENTGLYWHFVDIVWVFLFAILYII